MYNIGCTDSLAVNYDPAEILMMVHVYGTPGCTDALAYNYDASATVDDGSYVCSCWICLCG